LKGANQKSDALIDTLVVHFSSPSFLGEPEPLGEPSNRKLKSNDVPSTSRIKDAPVTRRPATSASNSRLTKVTPRPGSRMAKAPETESFVATASGSSDWEGRLKRMEEAWIERLKRAEAVFEERLRIVEEKWEARWASLQVRLYSW